MTAGTQRSFVKTVRRLGPTVGGRLTGCVVSGVDRTADDNIGSEIASRANYIVEGMPADDVQRWQLPMERIVR